MEKKLLLGSAIICIAFLFYLPTRSKSFDVQEEYVSNEVLVKFKRGTDINDIRFAINSIQGKIIKCSGDEISLSSWNPENSASRSFRLDPNLLHIKVPDFIGTEYAIYLLNQNPYVEYAEENSIGHLCEVEPSDPYFGLQWALKNTGQGEATEEADIKATFAWDYFTGNPDVVVAVIDSGIIILHEDLWMENIYFNENDPINGQDDDNNGYTDDFHGWDFVDGDNCPNDGTGHGTHVAGIIGAKGNNSKGIAGVNWNVKIMVLRVADGNGDVTIKRAVDALDYATENGAHLSNN